MSRCKCPKSDIKEPEYCPPYFENITARMEERRCDLIGRQKYLRDKITTMERSIPALIAYSMWLAKNTCEDAPYSKVREIMKRFSPYPDQTEKLLESLHKIVKELNGETTELHEKIIQADVKLEETGMELESIELANKEMNDTLNNLEKELKSYTSPSLHSIHSEDLICLSKIRQLAEEELNMKNCIKELEQKETLFKEHMDRLLISNEYQNVCGRRRMISCIQDVDCSGKRICYVPRKCLWHKPNGHRPKKKVEEKETDAEQTDAVVSTSEHSVNIKQDHAIQQELSEERVEKKSSWMPNWWKSNNKTEEVASLKSKETAILLNTDETDKSITAEVPRQSSSPKKESKEKKVSSEKSYKSWKTGYSILSCKPCGYSVCPSTPSKKSADSRGPKRTLCAGKYISPCNIPCNILFKVLSKYTDPSLKKPFCQPPRCTTADHGIRRSCKPFVLPCDLESPCEICPSTPCKGFVRPVGNCRCNYRGKDARGLSDTECNCSDTPLDPLEEHQPPSTKQANTEESNSENEYCECCTCGCEDSDASLSCQCN